MQSKVFNGLELVAQGPLGRPWHSPLYSLTPGLTRAKHNGRIVPSVHLPQVGAQAKLRWYFQQTLAQTLALCLVAA